jgi:membrane fusion protein, copper/silver efflux system
MDEISDARSTDGTKRRLLTISVGIALGAALLALLALVQHLRHGWPFSLHHDIAQAPAPTGHPHTPGREQHRAEPRTEVTLFAGQAETFGIEIEPARTQTISRSINAVATVVPDESRISHVHPRVSGWIERLHVSKTGQRVRKGQALASIFSQDLLLAQTEYLLAQKHPSSKALSDAARTRLEVFGLTNRQIEELARTKRPEQNVTIVAPRSGIVLQRGISVGTAVDPSTRLMSVVDLSIVWVIAEITESDIPDVATGSVATLSFPATKRGPFEAEIDYVYPTLSERTRTLQVRFVVENADGELRPGSYGRVTLATEPREAVTVSRDAVIDTGFAKHVFVTTGENRFIPRTVVTGVRVDDRIEIHSGLEAGELVVSSGVFLIDSESRLRASGFAGGHAHASASMAAEPDPHAGHGSPP